MPALLDIARPLANQLFINQLVSRRNQHGQAEKSSASEMNIYRRAERSCGSPYSETYGPRYPTKLSVFACLYSRGFRDSIGSPSCAPDNRQAVSRTDHISFAATSHFASDLLILQSSGRRSHSVRSDDAVMILLAAIKRLSKTIGAGKRTSCCKSVPQPHPHNAGHRLRIDARPVDLARLQFHHAGCSFDCL